MGERKIIEIVDCGQERYCVRSNFDVLGRMWDNEAEEFVVVKPQSEVESACTMIVMVGNDVVDHIVVGYEPIKVTSNLSQYPSVKVGFSFSRADGYIKNSEITTFYFLKAMKPSDFVPVEPEQKENIDLLIAKGFTGSKLENNELVFYGVNGEVVSAVRLSGFVQEQSDLGEVDETKETFVKGKSTKNLLNEGEDGTSPYATQDYVERNGGKIDSISVNGTPQEIDENKNVDIAVPTKVADLGDAGDYAKTSQVGAIENSVSGLSEQVGQVEQEIADTNEQVNQVKQEISGINEKIGQVDEDISGINGKIPSQASSTNQLADKEFVNSSISTATATFKGTYNNASLLPTTNVDINDYAFVVTTDSAGNTVYKRYKYDGTQWVFEYNLNNSSFTASQWNAINSGATKELVDKISTNETKISALQTNKANNSDLATVAKSGDYNDLSNKPTNNVTTDTNQTIDGQKTFTKRPLVNQIKNLFDMSKASVEENKYIGSDGKIGISQNFTYTELIPLEPNTTYTLSAQTTGDGTRRLHLYDANGEWISNPASVMTNKAYTLKFTTTSDTAYCRFSYNVNDYNIQLEKGSTATAYEPYPSYTSEEVALLSDIPEIPDNLVTTDTDQEVEGKKVFRNIQNNYGASLVGNDSFRPILIGGGFGSMQPLRYGADFGYTASTKTIQVRNISNGTETKSVKEISDTVDKVNDSIKRYKVRGYLSGSETVRYYPLCKLPVYNSNNNGSTVIIQGRLGGWTLADCSDVNIMIGNRSGEKGAVLSISQDSQKAFGTVDLVQYRQDDGTTQVYLKCSKFYVFDINLQITDTADAVVTINYDGTYISEPVGTLQWSAGTATNRFEVSNGIGYINGKQIATV